MPSRPDEHELAAVVADGRAFDWSALGAGRDVRLLSGLWRAVREQLPVELAGVPAARARLTGAVALLALLAISKGLVTVAVAAVASRPLDVAQLATLVSFGVVGTALVYGGVRDLRARHLGVLLLLIGSVVYNPLLRQGGAAWSPLPLWLPWLRGLVVEAFVPAGLWLFVRDFPSAARSPRYERHLRRGLRVSAWLGCVLLAANLAIAADLQLPGLWTLDRNAAATGYYWPLQFLLVVPALLLMIRRRRDGEPAERAKVTAFVTALTVAVLPAVLVIGLAGRDSPLRPWLLAHFQLTGVLLYTGLIVMPATTAYAVLAHRVMRVELVLRNAARYALARGTLTAAIGVPLGLLALYMYRHRDLPVGAVFADAAGRSLLLVAAGGVGLLLLRQRLLAWIERALRRDSVTLATALEDFARRANQGLGLGDVAEALSRSATAAFHPEVVALLVADQGRDAFVSVGAAVRPLARSSWLARALVGTRDPVVVDLEELDSVARLLPRPDQEWLADAGAVVLVPLAATGGDVCAVLALGRMASTQAYGDADLRFLSALAGAAAPAVEARLLRASPKTAGRHLDEVDWDDESGRECRSCGQVFASDANTCAACAQPTASMAIPARLHGKFAVRRRLGAGGMGVVYLAQDEALDRLVALKALPGVHPDAVERLRREARAMARVSHPALATILGVESWRAAPVLVVEYLAGGTLADRLAGGPLPEAEVIAVARQVLGGLSHLHRAGMLHRDLKPSNIGFTADGQAKVLDFGLSRLIIGGPPAGLVFGSDSRGVSRAEDAVFGASGLAGTPLYMSPEALDAESPDARVDLWALAVVIHEALAGAHLWAGLGVDDVLRRIGTTSGGGQKTPPPQCSPAMGALLARALDRDASRRPQTADEFGELLAGLPR